MTSNRRSALRFHLLFLPIIPALLVFLTTSCEKSKETPREIGQALEVSTQREPTEATAIPLETIAKSSKDVAESSAVIWLGVVSTQFPTDREAHDFQLGWHRKRYPQLYPDSIPPLPPPVKGTVVLAATRQGVVFGGVPLPKGFAQPEDGWKRGTATGRVPVETAVASRHRDGSVAWLFVSYDKFDGDLDTLMVAGVREGSLPLPSIGTPPPWATLEGETNQVRFDHAKVGDRDILRVTNLTPTGVKSNQPTCAGYGTPEERAVTLSVLGERTPRWAFLMGLEAESLAWDLLKPNVPGSTLRAGEAISFELASEGGSSEPALPLAEPAWYQKCASDGVIAGGPLPGWSLDVAEFAAYEGHVIVALDGIWKNNPPTHWMNPRDALCTQRDWDGGNVNTDYQTDEDEYNKRLGQLRQALRLPRGDSDPRVPGDLWKKALDLGLRGARHGADGSIYHVHDGPLPWMYGAHFQHPRHGGSGNGTEHRCAPFPPNAAHQNGRVILLAYYLTGDPTLLASWRELADRARIWTEDWAPPKPGYANFFGEHRAAANLIAILLDDWKLTRDPKTLEALEKAVNEGIGKRSYGLTDRKPWQEALLAQIALEVKVEGVAVPGLDALLNDLAGPAYVADPVWPHIVYQLNHPDRGTIDEYRDMWNLYAADALNDRPLAEGLFSTGSKSPWYPNASPGYTKYLNSGGLLCAGQWYMTQKGR